MKKIFNINKLNIFITFVIILSFIFTPFFTNLLFANPGYLVCLDPGHGGRDPGAVGATGLMEKVVNLDIAYKVKSKLQAKGYSVIMTRTSDTAVSLEQRVAIANNKKATIFVSIHNNAFILPAPHGTETYYSSSGAPYGYYLADAIQQRVVANTGSVNRGTKDGGFYVLNHTNMPAALHEGEFLSNPDKEALLKTDAFRNKIAQGIYEGIVNYLNKYGGGEPSPSAHYTPGKDLGYFIFKTSDGVFKLRWSGNGPAHSFTGVVTTDGKFTNVNKYAFTSEDSATVSTNKISFNAKAAGGEDGLDFKLSNATKITFDIKIDNKYMKDKVFIKETKNNPTSVPFTLDMNLAQITTTTTTTTPPTTTPTGKPSYTPGKDLGYFIFKTSDGVFKLRWSGNGPAHSFTGVVTTDGKFTNVNKYAFTSEDSATVSTNKISFNAKAAGGEDGLDFKLSNATKITFDIKIDNKYMKDKVYIKETKNNPTSVPFSLDMNLAQITTTTTTTTPPTTTPTGKPSYTPGKDLGYFIFKTSDGVFKIRWSGNGPAHSFTGVVTTDGKFTNVNKYAFTSEDSANISSSKISFNAKAAGGEDGLDFKLSNATKITFDIKIDNKYMKDKVYIKETKNNPTSVPFTLDMNLAQITTTTTTTTPTTTTPTTTTPSGKPSYTPGKDLGYFIFKTSDGVFKIRWSGNGPAHSFTGVVTTDGKFTNVNKYAFTSEDSANISSSKISFNAKAAGGEDGLDFKLSNATKITFDIKIDNKYMKDKVYIKETKNNPTSVPFSLDMNLAQITTTTTTTTPPTTTPTGKPSYTPGKDLGYFIFKTSDGVFKIRWSGNGPVHSFTGVITTDGKFTNVNKYAFTSEDSANISSSKISFNAKAGGYEDGLDFKLSNANKITFDIKIDNKYIKDKVFIKETKNNPTVVPFTLDMNLAQITTTTSTTTTPTTTTLPTTTISNSTSVRGISSATKNQMLNMFKMYNTNKLDKASRIADLYIKWGNKFGIRADIAWAQMCHETNFLKYDGIVPESANNFCGLGATGPGVYLTFNTEELGVIAHYAHLAWYVYPDHVNSYCSDKYDPRHSSWGASPPHNYNGDHTLNCLNGKWAPSSDYTYKIIKFANEIYN